MKVADRLLREGSYNTLNVPKNKMDYGAVYYMNYMDEGGDSEHYYVFILHPDLDDKVHCLDLSLVEDTAFRSFFHKIRLNNEQKVSEAKQECEGYVIDDIKNEKGFYNRYIKRDRALMKHNPYKTLKFNKISNVRYIPYDVY